MEILLKKLCRKPLSPTPEKHFCLYYFLQGLFVLYNFRHLPEGTFPFVHGFRAVFVHFTIFIISQKALFPWLMPLGLWFCTLPFSLSPKRHFPFINPLRAVFSALYHFRYLPKGTFPFVNTFRGVLLHFTISAISQQAHFPLLMHLVLFLALTTLAISRKEHFPSLIHLGMFFCTSPFPPSPKRRLC